MLLYNARFVYGDTKNVSPPLSAICIILIALSGVTVIFRHADEAQVTFHHVLSKE